MSFQDNKVAVTFTGLKGYPTTVPFNPSEKYPEYLGVACDPGNKVYGNVRETLHRLGLDRENYGTSQWNPLGTIVTPGMTVLVKPNTVRHFHIDGKDIFSVIIHASVLRPILDYILIALKGQGRIIIGDSQVLFGHFDEAMRISQIGNLVDWYRGQTPVPIECFDFRIYRRVRTWLYGEWGRKTVRMDPRGYTTVDLGAVSNFRDIDPRILRINVASHKDMYKCHSDGRHEYVFPNSVLQADAIISIAKMKTHRRTAVTLAIKNFMGLPAWKDSLPHFRIGSPEEGGDQYPNRSWRKRVHTNVRDWAETTNWVPAKFLWTSTDKAIWATRWLVPFKDNVNQAMWHGNDTLWRTLLDINRAVFYSDKDGKLHDSVQKNYFCLVDGIVGGEKDGPISCEPVYPGVLAAGLNPVAIDVAVASLMGFDIEKIPIIKRGIETLSQPAPLFFGGLDSVRVIDQNRAMTLEEFKQRYNLKFAPHPNWVGHVERVDAEQAESVTTGAKN
ncbi:MAG: DUF362 domain-containing protein [Terriglobales bacterium]